MRQCLAAYTSREYNLPAFINITMVDHGFIEIMVRAEGAENAVTLKLSGNDFNALIGELLCRR